MINFNNFGPVILFCTVIAGAVVLYERKKQTRLKNEEDEAFWKREAKANATRRKDISHLNYIDIPINTLPFINTEDSTINEYQDLLRNLGTQKILNLTGISNTDLKLKYGAANLPLLTEYDGNYITLVNTISLLGSRLLETDHKSEALAFLEYGISLKTDVSNNYCLLADEYRKMGRPDEIDRLIEAAGRTSTIMTPVILKKLTEIRSYCD